MTTAVGSNERPWPLRLALLFLFLETLGFQAIAVVSYQNQTAADAFFRMEGIVDLIINSVTIAGLFETATVLTLLSVIGFLRRWRSAWLLAMSGQGVALAVALVTYFRDVRFYVFPVLVVGVFLVIFLHTDEVRETAEPPATAEETS